MAQNKKNITEDDGLKFSSLVLLTEDDDGSGDYGFYSGGVNPHGGYENGGGYAPSSGKSIGRIFFDPLADIAKTAVWGIERIAANIRLIIPGFAKVLFFGMVPWSEGLIPGSHFIPVSHVFNKLRREEEKLLNKIDNKYKDVLQRNIQALQSNDAWGLALLLNPEMLIGEKLIRHSPDVAYFIINTFTGGLLDEFAKDAHAGDYLHEEQEMNLTSQEKILHEFLKKHSLSEFEGFKELEMVGAEILIKRFNKVMNANSLQEFSNELDPKAKAALQQMINRIYLISGGKKESGQEIGVATLQELKKAFKKIYLEGLIKLPQSLAVKTAVEQIKSSKL